MPRSIRRAVAAAALLLIPATASAASTTRPCPDATGFSCTRISVPLDRTGTVPGTLSLRFATEAGRAPKKKVLLALTGGPGQPGVLFGPSYASGFAGLLDDHSLVVLDQRGTGGSLALNCPEIQAVDSLEPLYPQDVAACAERLGPARDSFASIDTADDIEAVRKKLGVDKIAIYGVSYGTWVAQQYARAYPTHVERLILDSVVPPGADPWDVRITQALPRVLGQLCHAKACTGITEDPMADLTAVVRRIQAQGKLTAVVRTRTGGRLRGDLSQVDLLYILVSSDLNPFMQSRIPAALKAAREGDYAPLIRLKPDAAGPSTPLSQFSGGLFVTTTCLDNQLPFSYADAFADRRSKAEAALEQLPAESFAPFDRASIDVSSVPEICLHWPDGVFRPESQAPMPDVPTLILSGSTDLRTSSEGARALAAEVPHAQFLTLDGSGHDVFDSDYTGCVDTAIDRFFRDKPIGTPCKRESVLPRMVLVPPASLAAVAPVPGLPASRGRILRATLNTIADASTSDNEAYYAGFDNTGAGGLRGGFFESITTGRGQVLVLRRLEYVPGVWLTGSVLVDGSHLDGIVKVTAPAGRPAGRVAFFGTKIV
ncbi:MAG: alpha/beta fold hydrolase, partial [Solirubrobacterales bacterium]|nr:alpha/beta fold hydrolase [Solirubrobacterales bacterium]